MSQLPSTVSILGMGKYLPETVLTNDDLSQMVDTNDAWIHSRTGIRQRRIAQAGQSTSDMAVIAARAALADAQVTPSEIDLVIVATMSPDVPTPSTAAIVQSKLGMSPVAAFDVSAACSGFIYGIDTAVNMLRGGRYQKALLIGAEKMSSIVDWKDRSTCVLFGDGAAAVVLGKEAADNKPSVVDALLRADGHSFNLLYIPAGGAANPATETTVQNRDHFMKMNGREIFKSAVKEMANVTLELLERNGLTSDDIACIVPHQANTRIIDSLAKRLGVPSEQVFVNIDLYGNTSAASIPIALVECCEQGRLPRDGYVLSVAFGAGLTWGSTLFHWRS